MAAAIDYPPPFAGLLVPIKDLFPVAGLADFTSPDHIRIEVQLLGE
jgi:hypothetical protein